MSNATVDQLLIQRRLDVDLLSKEAIEYFEKFENGPYLVEGDRPRDYIWTDEIVAATVDFVITDPDGEILADGFGSIIEAETARAGARVSFKLELPNVAPVLGYTEPDGD